ncbi:zinc ribbon domain-containing protein [Hydrogenibacillus schlegelii]
MGEPEGYQPTCPRCGYRASENRSGIRFRCRECGSEAHVAVVGAWTGSLAISGLAAAA